MIKFLLSRLLQAVPVLIIVITATFFIVHAAPGGPFSADKAVPPEVIQALEAQYKLDQPVWRQYLSYLGDIARGDFGPSFKYPGRSVNELIMAGLPITAELAFYAMIIAILIGVLSGVGAAMRPNTLQDYVPMTLAMIGICMPSGAFALELGTSIPSKKCLESHLDRLLTTLKCCNMTSDKFIFLSNKLKLLKISLKNLNISKLYI